MFTILETKKGNATWLKTAKNAKLNENRKILLEFLLYLHLVEKKVVKGG